MPIPIEIDEVSSPCDTCRHFGVIDGGDWVPYGSSGARLPEVHGCVGEWDTDEDGEPIDVKVCTHYEELPKCSKHPDEYVTAIDGCGKCEEEAYSEMLRERDEEKRVE